MERAYKVPTAAASLNEPLDTTASASLNEPLGTPRLQPWVSQHSAEGPSSLPQAGVEPQAERPNCLPRCRPPLQAPTTRSLPPSAQDRSLSTFAPNLSSP